MNRKGRSLFIGAFLAPAVLLYGGLVVWPLAQTFWLSLFKYKGLSANKTFVGADNYAWLSHSKPFWTSLSHNLYLLSLGGGIIFLLSLALAHALQGKGRVVNAIRGVFLFPQVISLVVVAVIWQFMLNPNHGLANASLDALHLSSLKSNWLSQGSTALPSVTCAFIWWGLGFYVMLFSAGLQGISTEIGEAAELDGVTGLLRFWRITWPMLWSIRRVAAVYLLSNVLNVFALVFVMTQGGPDRATDTVLTFLYQTGFEQSNYGRASAVAATTFVIALALSGGLFWIMRRDPEAAR